MSDFIFNVIPQPWRDLGTRTFWTGVAATLGFVVEELTNSDNVWVIAFTSIATALLVKVRQKANTLPTTTTTTTREPV